MINLTYDEIQKLREILPKFWNFCNEKTTLYGIMQNSEQGKNAWDEQTKELINEFIEIMVDVKHDGVVK